jgi:hemerythrin superfamily protein
MTELRTRDIVELLEGDHEVAKALLEEIDGAASEIREDLFWKLVPALVAHEVAEEIVVYPTIRELSPDGNVQAEARIKEQSEAEEKLAQMEKMDPKGDEFASEMHALKLAVLEHAEAEEENVFPLLEALEDRAKLGERYEQAKKSAPTHPHPHSPDTPTGSTVLDPVVALFDKARDAARNI